MVRLGVGDEGIPPLARQHDSRNPTRPGGHPAAWMARVIVVTAPERLFGSRPGGQALASLTSLCLAGRASIAAALRFHAAAQIAHCERS
jgi:hypothetical protein